MSVTQQQPPPQEGQDLDPTVAMMLTLGRITQLLRQLLGQDRAEVEQIGVTNAPPAQLVLNDFPVTGTKRLLARRTGNGYSAFAVDTTGSLFVRNSEGRLGGQVTNTGSSPVLLYLADQAAPGRPCVYLAPGAAWNFLFGQLLWCGDVYAITTTGTSTLVGGEL